MKQNCYYNEGKNNKTPFVFSCPGNEESTCKKPIAGKTGTNFELVLVELKNSNLNSLIKTNNRYDYRITNAWSKVESKSLTNRTQATNKEIFTEKNLERLTSELKDISDLIICWGRKAEHAVTKIKSKLNANVIILYAIHTSPLAFNRLGKTEKQRISVISKKIFDGIKETKQSNRKP